MFGVSNIAISIDDVEIVVIGAIFVNLMNHQHRKCYSQIYTILNAYNFIKYI